MGIGQAEAGCNSSFSPRKQFYHVIYFVIDHILFSGSLFSNMESGKRIKRVRNTLKTELFLKRVNIKIVILKS